MDFFEVIHKRYSHKASFDSDTPVPDEDLLKIAEAGIAAPSGANWQTPEFIIVNDRAIVTKIGEISGVVSVKTAPALIAVVCNTAINPHLGVTFYMEDVSAATENLVLAATALGYGCGWIDGFLRDPAKYRATCDALGVPADRLLVVIVPIGLPAEGGSRRAKKPFAQRASWNRYAVQR
jgi:nitroreductase